MKNEFQMPRFSKAVLTAVFVGIICTVICLCFNIFYREETGFVPSDFINVSTLIFAINILFLFIGFIYFLFINVSRLGNVFFIAFFVLLTAFCVWKTEGVIRSADHLVTLQFRGLLLGIVLITGISAFFLIPLLFNNKKFQELVI